MTFLGRSVKRYDEVVDAVCDHAACAPFIAGKLHKFFHGVDPSPTRRTELATIFRTANLEIRPLVEAILRDPAFFDPSVRNSRAKLPVEWVAARVRGHGSEQRRLGGQRRRTTSGSCPSTHRASRAGPAGRGGWRRATPSVAPTSPHDGPVLAEITNAPDMVGAALARCSVYEMTAATRASLDQVAALTIPKWQRSRLLLALVLCSPEFALA